MMPRLLAATVGLALLAGPAHAIFGDSEAHKRIDDQVKALQAATEQVRALDGRIGALEGTVNGGTLLNLLNQIEALTAEIARLRGELEAANNRLDTADKRARDLYMDVDGRLRVLEVPPPAPVAAPATAAPAIADPGLAPQAPLAETAPMPAVSTGLEPTPATAPSPTGAPKPGPVATLPTTRPGVAGESVSESTAYESAHAARRESRFLEAARLFQQFVSNHPSSALAAPAQYWIGDSLFNARDYTGAIAAQKRLLEVWPNSAKAPDALLNMASSQRESGDAAAERKTLEQLIAMHPASEAAEKARKRLAVRR